MFISVRQINNQCHRNFHVKVNQETVYHRRKSVSKISVKNAGQSVDKRNGTVILPINMTKNQNETTEQQALIKAVKEMSQIIARLCDTVKTMSKSVDILDIEIRKAQVATIITVLRLEPTPENITKAYSRFNKTRHAIDAVTLQ